MINLKLRLQNKAILVAIIGASIPLIYQILGMFGVVPKISQNDVINAALAFVSILSLLGIVVDPTTKGVSDSTQAMEYTEPK
jgi:phi LC3 family holin